MAKNLAMIMGGAEITRDIDLGAGETFECTFDPTAIPADFDITRLQTVAEAAETVCQVVIDWDLVGPVPFSDFGTLKAGAIVANDEPIPLDPAVIAKLPFGFLFSLIQSLTAASLPKSRTPRPENPETPSGSPTPGTAGPSTGSSSRKAGRNRSRST